MKIPLSALGIHFTGFCLGGCGTFLGDHPEYAVARTLCTFCTRKHNAETSEPPIPAPDKATQLEWAREYHYATMPDALTPRTEAA